MILVVRQDYAGIAALRAHRDGQLPRRARRACTRDFGHAHLRTTRSGQDLTELFNYLSTGYKPKRAYQKLLPAPKHAKRGLLDRIQREIEWHESGSQGLIQFKTNALEDGDVTRALYRAARVGVRVDLIVRDTCRLRPGIPGLSENVRVVSILGRFLEHARLYHFGNGGDDEYFIGSADCMKRNLVSRVEVLAPVEPAALREELQRTLDLQLNDRRAGWEMRADGSYAQRVPESGAADTKSGQERLIARAEARLRQATRLRRRRPRGIERRNVR